MGVDSTGPPAMVEELPPFLAPSPKLQVPTADASHSSPSPPSPNLEAFTADIRRRSSSRSPGRPPSDAANPIPGPPQSPVSGLGRVAVAQDGLDPLREREDLLLHPKLSFLPRFLQRFLRRLWLRNQGPILVAVAQLFGSLMNMSARLLELSGDGIHPLEILLIRQSITTISSLAYMGYMKTPHQPWGHKDVRMLLVARGVSGFFAIFGMWYSMMYLPLADATVITFLGPCLAGILCHYVLHEPYTRLEQVATAVALTGVVLIARPTALFTSSPNDQSQSPLAENEGDFVPDMNYKATAQERLVAVGVALVGVCGGAGALTSIRCIGKRAHPLISVNFFGMICFAITLVSLILGPILKIGQPGLRWVTPSSPMQYLLLFVLGVMGFTTQYLSTAGFVAEKSNRANAMVYTHMLFASGFDRWVFGHHMGALSLVGCALILGSAIGVFLMKMKPPVQVDDVERQGNQVGDEEASPMLAAEDGSVEDVPLQTLR